MSKIKVALIGVGNCASALVQGVYHYWEMEKMEGQLGLRHLFLGGYHPRDIEFVSAFDIDSRKVGMDLSEAIFRLANNTPKFTEVPHLGISVLKGPVLDGVSESLKDLIKIDEGRVVDVAKELRDSGAEIALNLLPSGAVTASKWYAEEAIRSGCAFVNATPTFIASDEKIVKSFDEAGLPVVGDDLADQIGATFLHKLLLSALVGRGVRVSKTYQLDVGGGAESLNTLDRVREVKRKVKTESVEAVLPYKASVIAGSTDYVEFLGNRRDSYFWVQGQYFGGAHMRLDISLNTIDAPNAGSIMFDVIRAIKIALNRGLTGILPSVSAYAFKYPTNLLSPEIAEQQFEEYVSGKRPK